MLTEEKQEIQETQEALFERIKVISQRVYLLNGFVQNDFTRMLDDGTITKEELIASLRDVDDSFDKVIDQLHRAKEDVLNVIRRIVVILS